MQSVDFASKCVMLPVSRANRLSTKLTTNYLFNVHMCQTSTCCNHIIVMQHNKNEQVAVKLVI